MDNPRDFLHKNRKTAVSLALVAIFAGLLWPEETRSEYEIIPDGLQVASQDDIEIMSSASTEQPETNQVLSQTLQYKVEAGDTLSSIFSELNLPSATMYRLLEADLDFVQLDTLMPGQTLNFTLEGDSRLVTRMELAIDPIRSLEYIRHDDEYEGNLITHDTIGVERSVHGIINGSFYLSAQNAGLTPLEIGTITRLFEEKINFSRELRAGDTFQVLFNDLYIDENYTGRSALKAVIINANRRKLAAFLHDDGQYYDEDGRSLNRAFLKSPLKKRYRISSHFNPTRLHPVTGRVSPHNGTDYATPIGTPIVAISDGVVTRAGNHQFAGKYVNIQHTDRYTTRHLHMDKIYVRQGQQVNIGDVIGTTGKTGRVTGPHLHFELHASDRPVNFITYRLPEGRLLDSKEMLAFKTLIRVYLARMNIADKSLVG